MGPEPGLAWPPSPFGLQPTNASCLLYLFRPVVNSRSGDSEGFGGMSLFHPSANSIDDANPKVFLSLGLEFSRVSLEGLAHERIVA